MKKTKRNRTLYHFEKGLQIVKNVTKSTIGKELGKSAVKNAPKVYKKVLVK